MKIMVFAGLFCFLMTGAAVASELDGKWSNAAGTNRFIFRPDGSAELIRDSTNGNPGRQTTTLKYKCDESAKQLTYFIVHMKLEGSVVDYDKAVNDEKEYKVPYTIKGGTLSLGTEVYTRE